jgi:hypothetical protein
MSFVVPSTVELMPASAVFSVDLLPQAESMSAVLTIIASAKDFETMRILFSS